MDLSVKEQILLCDILTRFAPGYMSVYGPMSCDYLPRQLEKMAEQVYNEVAEKLHYSDQKKEEMRKYFTSNQIDVRSKMVTVNMSLADPMQGTFDFNKWWDDELDFNNCK